MLKRALGGVSLLSITALTACLTACAGSPPIGERVGTTAAALDSVPSFGSNPGNLLMYRYVPSGMPAHAPLVVVLHGCTQTAADMGNAGWNSTADQRKFYVVYPQQQSANNSASCFNWFGGFNNPSDKTNITRGGGEDLSIKQMVDQMKADFSIDPAKVYVAGFSAGAAMTAVMLATWPDVFAAGGINAGVPYGCPMATNVDVFSCMNPGKTETAMQWGQAAVAGDPGYTGPYPRVSIWQGTMDFTVGTQNEQELIKQWTDVHGLDATAGTKDTVQSYPHTVWKDASGTPLVESYAITGMMHGFSVDAAHGCGTATQYTPDEHICTADSMAQFFGLAGGSVGGGAGQGDGGSVPMGDAAGGGNPGDAPHGTSGGCSTGGPLESAPRGGAPVLALLGVLALGRRRRARLESP